MQTYIQLTHTGKHIVLEWVPAHVGITGNEMADCYAKKGLDGNKVAENMNYSVNELMFMAIPKLKEHWQNDWDGINRKWHYKIKARVEKNGPTTTRPRTTRMLTKLRIGWSHCLGVVRFKLGIYSTPNCRTCGVPEDIEHHLGWINIPLGVPDDVFNGKLPT